MLPKSFDELLKLIGIAGAIVSFLWAVYQWRAAQASALAQREYEISKTTEQRRIEAQKPFLDRQLTLYTEVIAITSKLAAAAQPRSDAYQRERTRFWELYWGELATVENSEVATRMFEFGKALNEDADPDAARKLQQDALALAHAVRNSLDQSWGIRVWTNNR